MSNLCWEGISRCSIGSWQIDKKEKENHKMLIHESHVFELWIEMKFEVCDPHSSFSTTYDL